MPQVIQWVLIACAFAMSLTALLRAHRTRRAARSVGAKPKTQQPTAAYIEILEKGRATNDTLGGSLVLPNEVRINGIPLAVPEGRSVVIHETSYGHNGPDDVAQVTLTLFARRITVAAEGDLATP